MSFRPLQTLPALSEAYREILLPMGQFAVGFLVVFLVGWLLVEPAVSGVVRRRNRKNPTIHDAVRLHVRLAVVLVAIVVGLATAGYGYVLTGSTLVIAAATLAIGVAGQEVIGALVSGLFLVVNPNFNVGDWIAWKDREGVVKAIGFRTTRVRTPDNEIVTVPNTELTTSEITRRYARDELRVTDEVGIGYDDDVEAAMTCLGEAAADTPAILDDPGPRVYLVAFDDDAVILRIQYWIQHPTREELLRVRSRFSAAVKARFDANGFSLSPASGRELSGTIGIESRGERPSVQPRD